ncbi:hypothetical protein [Virgisporangium aliadipatigenens]|uniref:hypothetical protein n=1 Tax=Virgisporangium aliadipatigenens TaxID=741659 RepID=UPI001940B34B|nr:hypothetical protein [Virgisporangium aliadipatigenens]
MSVSAENVQSGETVRLKYRVTNNGQRAETAIIVIGGGLSCNTGCRAEPNLGAGRSQDFEATLVAPKANPGEVTGLNISVGVRLAEENTYDHKMVYVHGPGTSIPGAGKPTPTPGKPTPSPVRPSPSTVTPPSSGTSESAGVAANEAIQRESGTPVAAPDLKAVSDEGGQTLLFAVLGGLLVAACVGALVLVRRRKASHEPVPPAATP